MEPIKQGYLIKSPPEKKIHERKFFKAKWRKRYFVLHLPPSSLPGNYALDYFGDSHCKKVLGSIDLTQCELIHSALDSSHYKYLFSLKTKHKGKSRTYFLAAETEEEMTKWVECLCKVCGFLPDVVRDEELPPQPQFINTPEPAQPPRQQPAAVSPPRTEEAPPLPAHSPQRTSPVPQNNNIHVQDSYIPLEECYSDPKKAREVTLPKMPASPLDVVPPAPGYQMFDDKERRKSTESIPDEPPPPPPSKVGSNGRTPYMNLDSMDDGLYKVPPRGEIRQSEVYQVPPTACRNYQEGPPVTDDFYAVPPRREDGHNMARDSWNQVPPVPHQTRQSYGGEDWYDVPPRTVNQNPTLRESVSSNSDSSQKRYTTSSQGTFDDIYDTPKPANFDPLQQVPQAPYQGSPLGRESYLKGQETYDVPKSASSALHQVPKPYHSSTIGRDSNIMGQGTYDIPPARHAVSDNNLLGSVPPPPVKDVGGESLHQQTKYYNLNPSSQPIYNSPRPLTRNLSVNVPPADDTYDVPPQQQKSNDANILEMSFPPPKPHMPKPQATPPQLPRQEAYVPMHGNTPQPGYFAMRNEQLQNYENLDRVSSLPRDIRGSGFHPSHSLHSRVTKEKGSCKAPPLMSMTNVPVRQSLGTKHEFYTVHQTQRTQSFKRNIRSDDVLLPTKRGGRDSSDSDDESGTSTESHNQSSDSLKNPGLEQKPPAPRKSKEVQYLDLEHSDPEKSPTSKTRSPPVNLISGSATDYGEIDFIKTKALSETKRDVENKRKSSDKSVDE